MSFIASASMTYGDMGVTGDFSDPKNLQWSLNSEGFVKAVQWACDLSKFSPPSSATGQGFETFGRENNDVAIQIDRPSGAVMSTYYQSGDESMIARYGVSMNIGPDGSNWTPVDGVALNATLQGDDLPKGWEIMKELAGKDITTWRFKNWGPSAQPHLVSAELYDPKDLGLAVNNKIIEVSGVHPGYEMNPFYGSGIQPVLASMISRTMAGETVDVQKELDDLQAKAVAWSATK
jgi:hypothetical protein